ncbi:MAG: hypothetical protein V7638_1577 [Acidobacteriota bacterium]|jgi:hypothetical protein
MSDTKKTAETPVNDGGTTAPQDAPPPTEPTEEAAAETPVNQGGGGD